MGSDPGHAPTAQGTVWLHRAACRAPSRATERARASQGCGSIRHSTHSGGRGGAFSSALRRRKCMLLGS